MRSGSPAAQRFPRFADKEDEYSEQTSGADENRDE
jgi:hypothetical protein